MGARKDRIAQLEIRLSELRMQFKGKQLAYALARTEQNMSHNDAAKAAGYALTGDPRVKDVPEVVEYLRTYAEHKTLVETPARIASYEQKRAKLWAIARRATDTKTLDSEGEARTYDAKAAISAIAELNKMDGDLAAQRSEQTILHKVVDLTDSELRDEIAKLVTKLYPQA